MLHLKCLILQVLRWDHLGASDKVVSLGENKATHLRAPSCGNISAPPKIETSATLECEKRRPTQNHMASASKFNLHGAPPQPPPLSHRTAASDAAGTEWAVGQVRA